MTKNKIYKIDWKYLTEAVKCNVVIAGFENKAFSYTGNWVNLSCVIMLFESAKH